MENVLFANSAAKNFHASLYGGCEQSGKQQHQKMKCEILTSYLQLNKQRKHCMNLCRRWTVTNNELYSLTNCYCICFLMLLISSSSLVASDLKDSFTLEIWGQILMLLFLTS